MKLIWWMNEYMDLEYLWSDIIFKILLLLIVFIWIKVWRTCPSFYALCQKQHDQGCNCNGNNEAQWSREFFFHLCLYLKPVEVNQNYFSDTVVFGWSPYTGMNKKTNSHEIHKFTQLHHKWKGIQAFINYWRIIIYGGTQKVLNKVMYYRKNIFNIFVSNSFCEAVVISLNTEDIF